MLARLNWLQANTLNKKAAYPKPIAFPRSFSQKTDAWMFCERDHCIKTASHHRTTIWVVYQFTYMNLACSPFILYHVTSHKQTNPTSQRTNVRLLERKMARTVGHTERRRSCTDARTCGQADSSKDFQKKHRSNDRAYRLYALKDERTMKIQVMASRRASLNQKLERANGPKNQILSTWCWARF